MIRIDNIMLRTYTELLRYHSFQDRFNYLSLKGVVAEQTFGFDRYLNQRFYKSKEWKNIREKVIIRDNGCDLGLQDFPIYGNIIIHHMNPVSLEGLSSDIQAILDPEYLICVSLNTHNAIHYGDLSITNKYNLVERSVGDTILW